MANVLLVVCGAPLSARVEDMHATLSRSGWVTHIVGTPASKDWISEQAIESLSIRFDFRMRHRLGKLPAADAVAVCPATFNTLNKVAAGLADNYATSLLCEAVGDGLPVVAVPMVNQKLWGHPQWGASLAQLAKANLELVDLRTGKSEIRPIESGSGDEVVRRFDPMILVTALKPVL